MLRKPRARLAIVSVLVLTAIVTVSTFIALAQGELQLGNQTYSRVSAPALRMPVTRSVRFFAGVGGVAFSAVANGQAGQVVTALRYDAAAADGERLVITTRSADGAIQTVRGQIYDWQLVPTAKYAIDENGSAVTLFGRLENRAAEDQVLGAGGRVINYHSALDNTLLGLRLFQADILIIQPNATDLFRQDGRIILGAGESGHDFARNLARFRMISEWQQSEEDRGNSYQSYVVGDMGQRVEFSVQNGSISFAGEPYWNAWRRKYRSAADLSRVEALEEAHDNKVIAYNSLLESAKAGKVSMQVADVRLDGLNAEIEAIATQLEELNAVEEMPAYSRALSDRIAALNGINPVVYRTLRTVMHYRALFKHYQMRNQTGLTTFVNTLRAVPVQPVVRTPTIQRASDSPQ